MSYNKKAIADALSKLNKARKPKQVNDIIMDPEGQNKFPGLPTMETTPYPVLGVDNFGNQQMMYPGANYTFPGADYVDEYPIAQYGGLVTGLTNTKGNLLMNSKGKRMMAKSGSLYATNKLFLGNPLVTKRKKAVFVPGHDFQTGGQRPILYVDPNNPAGRARYQAYQDSLYNYNYAIEEMSRYNPSLKDQKSKDFYFKTYLELPEVESYNITKPNTIKSDKYLNKNSSQKPDYIIDRRWTRELDRNDPDYRKDEKSIEYLGYSHPKTEVIIADNPKTKIIAKQQQLIDAGFDIGKADGIWGPKSQAAWEEFQKTQTTEPEVTPEIVPEIVSEETTSTEESVQEPVQTDQPQAPQQPSETPKSSEPKVRYHKEFNPYTRRWEPMSPKQKQELDRLNTRGLPAPQDFTPELIEAHVRQSGGATDWKSRIASVLKFQQGGQLSAEEFAKRKAAYEKVTGRKLEQPKTIKQSEKARQATLDKYNQLPVVQSQPSETVQQSRGIDTRREKEIVEAQANTDAKAAENYMHFYNKTYGSDQGAITYEQALQKVRQPNFDKAKYLNMYNLGESKNEQLQSFRKEDQANRTWEVITNPFTAFEYAVTTGDMANMPSNINAARMQGYDVGATPGRNMVGNALNMTTNLFDAGDKVVRNVGEGNLLGAGMEALRFLPGARMTTGLGKQAGKYLKLPGSPNAVSSVDDVMIKSEIFNPIAAADKIIPRPLAPGNIFGLEDSWNNYSPLNLIPGYGNKLIDKTSSYPNFVGFRKFGNSIEDVIQSQSLRPKGSGMGSKQIASEGNWAESGKVNENYSGVFEATMNPQIQGSNIKLEKWPKRNGVVGTTKEGNVAIPLRDPGLSFNRRLPFSNRYVPIDKQKLINKEFQLATVAPHLQSLAEKYAIWSGLGLAGAYVGVPQLHEANKKYIINPAIEQSTKLDNFVAERLGIKSSEKTKEQKQMGGWLNKYN